MQIARYAKKSAQKDKWFMQGFMHRAYVVDPAHLHGTFRQFSLGLFLVLEAYSADVPTSGQKHYTVKGWTEPALKLEQTSDCMSVVLVCVSAVCTYMCASASRQKWCCCRLPESGTPLSPADSKMLKRDAHIHTHTNTHARRWKSLKSVHRLAYLTS